MVPYRGYLKVRAGQQVRAGDRLTEGPLDPQSVLRLKGVHACQDYLVKEIQRVYRSQNVLINDKHIEVIVRQMLRKRKVLDHGSTDLLPGQVLDRFTFADENRRVQELGGRPATAEVMLLGITEASLQTESFLSAASFQKTTKILTDAAIRGRTDPLRGLKENVIIGRLIPAGSGMATYQQTKVGLADGIHDVVIGLADGDIVLDLGGDFVLDDEDVEERYEEEDAGDLAAALLSGIQKSDDDSADGEESEIGDEEPSPQFDSDDLEIGHEIGEGDEEDETESDDDDTEEDA